MPLAPLALALAPLLFSNPLAARPDLSAQVVDAPQEARPAVEPGAGAAPAAARKVPAGVRLSEQSCAAAAAYSENRAGRALLVVQGGRDVFETYANGWSADRPHPLASGTKSFNGVLAMAALEDGVIPGLDVPASTFVEEWADDPAKKDITIRQLLELSSGLAPNDPSLGRQGYGIKGLGPLNDFAQRLRRREDPPANRFEAALRVPSVAEPGAGFDYGPTHFYAFGALIERALAKSGREERTYFEYLKSRVLDPAGIPVDIERFAPDAANKPNLPGGGHFTAHEWARFGEWVLRGGAHVGEDGTLVRDLGEHALDPCFEPSATNPNYGLTWWLLNGEPGSTPDVADGFLERLRPAAGQTAQLFDVDGDPVEIVMAAGAGKQRLYLVPALDLVVVRFAEQRREGQGFDDTVFLRLVLGLGEQAE